MGLITSFPGGNGGSEITVDSELSGTSENPVQNKVIKAELDNKQDADDLMTPEDIDDVVTPLPGMASRLPRYSTEEQIVGYWIDGRPIYQKTVQISIPVTNKGTTTTVEIDTNSTHKLIRVWGLDSRVLEPFIGISIDGSVYEVKSFRYYDVSTQTGCILHYRNSSVSSDVPAHNAIVTLQYTKTTD